MFLELKYIDFLSEAVLDGMEQESRALSMQLSFVLELMFINSVSKESLADGNLKQFYERLICQCIELVDLINDHDKARCGQRDASVGICLSASRENDEEGSCIWIQRVVKTGSPTSKHFIHYGTNPKV